MRLPGRTCPKTSPFASIEQVGLLSSLVYNIVNTITNTMNNNEARRNDEEGDEEPKSRSWADYMRDEVTVSWGDAVLIAGCFATGLLDSAIFNVWSCFVSMQTGKSHLNIPPDLDLVC